MATEFFLARQKQLEAIYGETWKEGSLAANKRCENLN